MRFTGQVRIPDVDHPGVPATFLVEDDHCEVVLDGESLGRWSLCDVEATRLVSNAFSVRLGDEEITFLADEPMDFAYKGVEHMAEVWARYRSMTMPRRLVAVGRSRKGARPSRIAEVRGMMQQNVQGRPARRPGPAHPGPAPIVEAPPSAGDHGRPAETVFQPAPPDPAPALHEAPPAPVIPSPLRPGAGLYARRPPPPADAGPVADPGLLADAAPPADPVSLADVGSRVEAPSIGLFPRGTQGPSPRGDAWWEEEAGAPEAAPPDERAAGSAEDAGGAPPEGEAQASPVLAAAPSGRSGNGKGSVIDLDRLDEPETEPLLGMGREMASDEEETEPVLAAVAGPQERGGLLGAVRSAFVRNRVPHQHVFVEAPGGIGIVRQICTECGYVSIGVSD